MVFEECNYEWIIPLLSEGASSSIFPVVNAIFKWQLHIKSGQINLISNIAPLGTFKILCKYSLGNDSSVTTHEFRNSSLPVSSNYVTILNKNKFKVLLKSEVISHFKISIWAFLISPLVGNGELNVPHSCLATHTLSCLSNDSHFCDLIIETGSKKYNVHKSVIASVSSVFRAALIHNTRESNLNVISITEFDCDTVKRMIDFIYGRLVFLFEYKPVADLLRLSEIYDIAHLKEFCVKHITTYMMNEENVLKVILLADMNNAFNLKIEAIDYFIQSSKPRKYCDFEEMTKLRPLLLPELMEKLSEKRCQEINEKLSATTVFPNKASSS